MRRSSRNLAISFFHPLTDVKRGMRFTLFFHSSRVWSFDLTMQNAFRLETEVSVVNNGQTLFTEIILNYRTVLS